VLVNLTFALFFWTLLGIFCLELRVKINYLAKKILLSKQKTFKDNLLVLNLVQLLVSFALITISKMFKVNIYPGTDYSLLCFYCLTIKILSLRSECVLCDMVGVVPLLLLVSTLHTHHSTGSILQALSSVINWGIFFLPVPAIAAAVVSVWQVTAEFFSVSSLFSVISCASAVFVLITLKSSRSTFVILIFLLALKYTIPSASEYSFKSIKDDFRPKHDSSENFGDLSILGDTIDTFILLNEDIELPASNNSYSVKTCVEKFAPRCSQDSVLECSKVNNQPGDNKNSLVHHLVTIIENKTGDQIFPDTSSVFPVNSESLPDNRILGDVSSLKESDVMLNKSENIIDSNHESDYSSALSLLANFASSTVNTEDTEEEESDYLIQEAELDSSGQCSVQVLDLSQSNFIVKNFVRLNKLFHNIFPSFPSYEPFQLKKISLLGFSHLCLSLPGSEVSLISLGQTTERGTNNSRRKNCDCEHTKDSLVIFFSTLVNKFKKFVWSLC